MFYTHLKMTQQSYYNFYITVTKGKLTITVDLTMEHSRNISVDQPTTYTGPYLSIVHHPGYNTTKKKYLQHVVVLKLNVSTALILCFIINIFQLKERLYFAQCFTLI
jgi:hypothetical protein